MAIKRAMDKQLDKIAERIDKAIGGAWNRKRLQYLGEEAVKLIAKRTRLGYGVAKDGAKRFKLKALSPQYIEQRRDLGSYLSPLTRASKSNLTLTGDMLTQLKVKKVRARKKSVKVGFATKFADDKALWNTKKGRPFANLSELEIRQLVRLSDKFLRESLDDEDL